MNLRFILIFAVLIIVYLIARYFYYTGQGTKLVATSSKFERHYFVGDQNKPKLTYVVLGDSTAVGVGTDAKEKSYAFAIAKALAEQGHFVEVTNLAISGATVQTVLEEELPKTKELKPDVISLTVGANDATHNTPSEEFKQRLENTLAQLDSLKAKKVLIANTPNVGNSPAIILPLKSGLVRRSVEQNDILAQVIKPYPFSVVDLFGQGSLARPNINSLYAQDKFHPNAAGYAIWSKVFASKL